MLQRMGMALQGSLLDTADHLELRELAAGVQRTVLTRGAWVDYRPGWLAGGDELFDLLHRTVPWHAERREMYERMVDVPRLLKFYDEGEELPHPVLDEARSALSRHYVAELGEPLSRRACASTATAATRSPGTETASAWRRTSTPWSRSCRSAQRGR